MGLAGALALPVSADAASSGKRGNSLYIVEMSDQPVTTYQGGVQGFAATKPRSGQKIDPNSPTVVSYLGYLTSRHDATLARVGGGRKAYSYGYVFNGFAAEMTPQQAQQLARMPGVVSVSKDEMQRRDTSATPGFLGLSGPTGVWATKGLTGENVIIGIVDSGIWPEHPSFSDRVGTNGNATKDGKLGYQQIPGWHGRCVPGVAFSGTDCNQKLIGARYYNAGYGGGAGVLAELPYEILSPRDVDGHGSHTASTAGGNNGVAVEGPMAVFGQTMSGIAPRARIAAYKVCWGKGDDGGCFPSDSVAAIDQAVADGVDVINFSISGTRTNFRDPVEIAFLNASAAGVFVAASAGNNGPTSSTVSHPSPWITTVAAGTHSRTTTATLMLGNGASYSGVSTGTGAGPLPFVDAAAAALAGADPAKAALCYAASDNGGQPVLDPAKVAGKIVLCDRGVTARVDKSKAVKEAGGAGMVLVNVTSGSLNADLHSVPSIHLAHTDRPAVKAYAATAGATATIGAMVLASNGAAPFTASFSSRGPLLAGGGDLLKPDLIAPGQDIVAAVSPLGHGGLTFDMLSGTSMSSPHVAGLAALLRQAYPSWSPMAIKSALMTTGYDVLDGGTPAPNSNPVLIFRQGAGHVDPMRSLNPGVVFDSGPNEWIGFICGTQPGSFCSAYTALDPSNLNVPSIAIGDMAGVQTVQRRVTNVSGGAATFGISHTGMAGFAVTVTPSSLSLAKGETKSFTVKFQRTATAPLNAYTGGQLTLAGAGTTARIPMVVRPVALAAPANVTSSGAPVSYNVTFGYDGPFSATVRGLVGAATTSGSVADDPTNGDCSLSAPNAQLIPVTVPAGTTHARFALFDADVTAGADIDLCVFNSAGALVGSSGSGTSAEEVNLTNPAAGTYTAVVHGWGVVGSSPSPFKLHTWLLGSEATGNMAITAPAAATIGATGTIGLSFSGLATGTKYLGSVAYSGTSGMPAPTIVSVNP